MWEIAYRICDLINLNFPLSKNANRIKCETRKLELFCIKLKWITR